MNNLVFRRQIQYTVFVAVLILQLCRGAGSPLRRAEVLVAPPPAAALFYAGEIPAVSYPNSRGEELQVISFQRKKAPIFDRKRLEKGNSAAQMARTPVWGISGQMSGIRKKKLQPIRIRTA